MTLDTRPVKRIAVVGGGAAGVAQAKEILAAFRPGVSDYKVELVVYESRTDIGGVWLEDPEAGDYQLKYDANGIARALSSQPGSTPSPIYAGLRTNLPKQLMTYRNTPFPEEAELFPRASTVCEYIQAYARSHGVHNHIRFGVTVTRVRKTGQVGNWIVTSRRGIDVEEREDEFDFVAIANGHYEKVMIPTIPGLNEFPGTVLHSRWYRRPEEYIGKRVLVVGSFASGSDVARELASVALPTDSLPESMQLARKRNHHDHPDVAPKGKVQVFQSSSMLPNDMSSFGKEATEKSPWIKLIEHRPLIENIEGGIIHFNDGSTLEDVDVIIFATGYYYYFPFFKANDYPWSEQDHRVCNETIAEVDVVDEVNGWEKDGLQGLAMQGLDELKLFLKADRTCAFIALPYLVVPFPLAEVQSHLTALYWSGRLPNVPKQFSPPSREDAPDPGSTSKPDHQSQQAGNDTTHDNANDHPHDTHQSGSPAKKKDKRHTEKVRGDLVFGFPHEYRYENYVLGLTSEADGGDENGWGAVEDWRFPLRKNKGLRSETLGY